MNPNTKSATEIAALELRKAIIRGELAPGVRLVPAKLEAKMGLSRISIREAIRELVGSGLAESTTNKGAHIADAVDIDEIREIFEMRYLVEGKAAFLGAQHVTEAEIIRMEMILEKFEAAKSTYEGFFLNQEFHIILYQASGWKFLTKIIQQLFDQVLAFRSSLFRRLGENTENMHLDPSYLQTYLYEHYQILKLLREKNPEAVKTLTVTHLEKLGFEHIYNLYKKVVKKETMELVA